MNILIVIHLLITLALIGTVLLQKGESGGLMQNSQGSMFTARGSANFLTRITAVLAALFFGNCILMTFIASYQVKKTDKIVDAATVAVNKTTDTSVNKK